MAASVGGGPWIVALFPAPEGVVVPDLGPVVGSPFLAAAPVVGGGNVAGAGVGGAPVLPAYVGVVAG